MLTFDQNGKIDILALLPEELEEQILLAGEKKFRAKQIFSWLHVKQVRTFDEMTDLSAQLRSKLNDLFCIKSLFAVKKLESCTDNTVKYLYELSDGNHIESVLMEYEHGNTVCVSTQVGCKMGCRFCASTIAGYKRDLELEMLDPTGVCVQKWVLKNSWITVANFGNLDYSDDEVADITGTLRMDYAVLAY